MGASYELGRREGRFGGPEQPLSTLGTKGYIAYWSAEVARHVLNAPSKKLVTIKDISDATYIMPQDIVAALRKMEVVETRHTATGSVVINKSKVRAWAETHNVSTEPVIDIDAFVEYEEEADGVLDG